MLRIIYKNTIKCSKTPAACGGAGSSVKKSENLRHHIPFIVLGSIRSKFLKVSCHNEDLNENRTRGKQHIYFWFGGKI